MPSPKKSKKSKTNEGVGVEAEAAVALPSPNYTRQDSIIDLEKFGQMRIDIVGAGATGSRIVFALAKHGFSNLHVYDFDKVEAHNLPNQLYGPKHVGMFKVDALKEVIKDLVGTDITTYPVAYTGDEEVKGETVFLLVDTMKARKELFDKLKEAVGVGLVIETRMGVEEGRVYTITMGQDTKTYESTIGSDEAAPVSACGSQVTIGATADVVTGIAMWSFIEWLKQEQPPWELIFALTKTRMFIQPEEVKV